MRPESLLARLAAIALLAAATLPPASAKTHHSPPATPTPSPLPPSPPVKFESLHLTLRPVLADGSPAWTPPQFSRVYLSAELRGFNPGRGSRACLTPFWTVDAVGKPVPGPTLCTPPYVFPHWYYFTHAGTYGITLTAKTTSHHDVADPKTIYLEIQPAPAPPRITP